MNTNKLSFNAWMDHIADQLQSDYRKLYYSSKYKQDEKKDQRSLQVKNKALDLNKVSL